MFNYELEIKIDSKAEMPPINKEGEWNGSDYYFKERYYGFKVKDLDVRQNGTFSDRVFTMSGNSTLEELKTMFAKLAEEIIGSDMPPKYFKSGIVLLQAILAKQNETDYDNNLECEISRSYPAFGVRLYLYKIPAPVQKDPEPDGCVTGYLWEVTVPLQNVDYYYTVFCKEPEDAVHQTMDYILRTYPDIYEKYALKKPIRVTKQSDDMKEIPYIVTS